MKIGQYVDVAVTAVNPDGSQAAIPAGVLTAVADSDACTTTMTGDTTVRVKAVSVGVVQVTFSAPGFKPTSATFVVEDLPQLVVTLGPEQGP